MGHENKKKEVPANDPFKTMDHISVNTTEIYYSLNGGEPLITYSGFDWTEVPQEEQTDRDRRVKLISVGVGTEGELRWFKREDENGAEWRISVSVINVPKP